MDLFDVAITNVLELEKKGEWFIDSNAFRHMIDFIYLFVELDN
jgi:hypothetical protein